MGEIGVEGQTRVWLMQAQGGDQQGFSELYEHIAPSLHTWAHLRIRPEQSAFLDPADLVQEVWLRAWRQMETFEGDGSYFRFWIFRIAKNVLLEAVRKGQRTKGAGGSTTRLRRAHEQIDQVTAVSQRLARDESLELFRKHVADLPEDDRKLVLHCGLEGLPHAQVAERLGLGVEAVTKRWQRLRARLAHSELPTYLLA
ncbi:MAG: RNA polymerase sigma factor [Planctomycetes bacterium]|nr:RNA polymerase sigma factor [Planctomycetota bacterium]